MIAAKIDVTKIDKKRLFKGEKGTYLDIVLIETPNSPYGDFMICESVTREERVAGKKGTILGNGKYVGAKREAPKSDSPPPRDEDAPAEDGEDVPF